jgi:hypothetical protein
MIFTPTAPAPDYDLNAAECHQHSTPSAVVARQDPGARKRTVYAFSRSVLPVEGGRLLLRLTQTPRVALDPVTGNCEVLNWGVEIPATQAQDLPREMARRFLELFSKADSGELDEQEQAGWLALLDQVDFQAFCVDRAAPHYMEGVLKTPSPQCRVEWHDGRSQKISITVARALALLKPGDEFGAYVKLGLDNEVLGIERLVLI